MSKSQQMKMFDGHAVEKYQLQFKGSFSSEEVDVEDLAMDDHVCLMVIASVGESVLKKNNENEVIRVNKLDIIRAVELEAQVTEYALAKQAASAGSPMLPNFTDPDDPDLDDHRVSGGADVVAAPAPQDPPGPGVPTMDLGDMSDDLDEVPSQ